MSDATSQTRQGLKRFLLIFNDRGKAYGGEWHPPATRDWSKDPAGQQTSDQGASRYSGASLQSAPSHGMSQHADRDWPPQHAQWCREENTECGNRHARSDHVQYAES